MNNSPQQLRNGIFNKASNFFSNEGTLLKISLAVVIVLVIIFLFVRLSYDIFQVFPIYRAP